jgi:thiopeptide-type bacteriocin biosynthesis protein
VKLHLISSFLLRAPLLPVSALRRPGAALRAHPLGPQALALASPDLAAGLARGGSKAERAVDRYGRRAAFRATPHGLLAGVAMGKLGTRTAIDTATPRAYRSVAWARLAAIGRALLDDPQTRAGVRLRRAPSLLVSGAEAVWLALPAAADGALEVSQAEVDPPLEAVLAAAEAWSSWADVRAAAARGFSDEEAAGDDDALDDYLLLLVDQGVLHFDLRPPLVGRAPLVWMRERLGALGTEAAAEARRQLDQPTSATLIHGGTAVLSRATVARAAALAPLLFRLQEALAPPAAERSLGGALLERLESAAEIFGAGAFDLAGLATGAAGNSLAFLEEEPTRAAPPEPAILGHLVTALTEAARAGRDVIELDPAALDTLVPEAELPPSFELVLTPSTPKRGRRGKTDGWLLGLHAPAGASWGRFAHALGEPMTAALAELAAAESAAHPEEATADVSYAPSAALADLCVHPPVRRSALALVSWPEGPAIAPRELALMIDPAAPLGLTRAGERLAPSPLHRVRSTTAPPGLYRLLAAWSFVRQHAPWAFVWGALADLPRLPRVQLGGFVVAPASWRIPPADLLKGQGLRRWRATAALPRHVQVGEGDELLLVDLDRPGGAADLARHAGGRAFEIWPPLAELADAGGRRVEAVVAVVRGSGSADGGQPARAGSQVDQRRSAVDLAAAPGWTTYKLFGADERQDDVLLFGLMPVVAEAQATGTIDRWHFLRYVDGGTRDHLRLRVHASSERAGEGFGRRLRAGLAILREAGDLVAVETAEYFPERARYGGAESFEAVERLFELDSELVLRLLSVAAEVVEPLACDRVEWLVRGFDALARGLGLDLASRQALAARRRAAHRPGSPEESRALDLDFRARQRRLAGLLAGTAEDACSAPLDAHATRVQALAAELAPGTLASVIDVLSPVLHLNAVRLLGPRPDDEAAAYLFWERTLEGLAARRRRGA